MPVILGGDLNTNTFDGRAKEDIGDIAARSGDAPPLSGGGVQL